MTPPAANASIAVVEVWKLELKCYSDCMAQHEELKQQAYEVVIGQCSQMVCD